MAHAKPKMIISSLWFQAAIITFIVGFGLLGYLAYRIYTDHPPIPDTVTVRGGVLFTGGEILAGQHVFQKYALMQHGTLFGHGAYLGPDFTAQYLHGAALAALAYYRNQGFSEAEAGAKVQADFKSNGFDEGLHSLVYSAAQAEAYNERLAFYQNYFSSSSTIAGVKRPVISDSGEIKNLTSYLSWAAWVSAAARPGKNYSYTNNWPPEPLVGNAATGDALLWSALSLIALLGGLGLVFFAIGRYDILGWHSAQEERPGLQLRFRPPEQVRLAPAQRATAWYFLVIAALFLLQGLLGGVNAHYHVEASGFYGFDLARLLPYNLSRTWHLQLALFFVAASFLAMGIFITPMIAGREPKHQEKLALALFGALVVVVAGSLAGEALSIQNYITSQGPWFWLGAQGWEYLDLGRLWQILLVIGMVLWVVILIRGLREKLAHEHKGNLPYLFLYSALSIPLFYATGLAFGKNSNFAVIDFWRFWVVHLWVEDFLELFTTIMVAYMFVLLRVVHATTATRVVYLDIILYSVGGVVGTMHHLYFSGSPAIHMAFGAFFSAMEVIPLVLLTFEAWRFMRLGSAQQDGSERGTAFPHKWAVMFLIAVGFWNFLGAGVFGFLINLPIVSYYEIGTQFTANHGHAALMGVYGMLAMGFFMFVARYFIPPDKRSEQAMKISFWGLNIGLALMLFSNLIPVGLLQLHDSVEYGYWHAREPGFFLQPAVRFFEWFRMPGDAVFIVLGILPVCYLALRLFANRKRYSTLPPGEEVEQFTQVFYEGTAESA